MHGNRPGAYSGAIDHAVRKGLGVLGLRRSLGGFDSRGSMINLPHRLPRSWTSWAGAPAGRASPPHPERHGSTARSSAMGVAHTAAIQLDNAGVQHIHLQFACVRRQRPSIDGQGHPLLATHASRILVWGGRWVGIWPWTGAVRLMHLTFAVASAGLGRSWWVRVPSYSVPGALTCGVHRWPSRS